MKMNKHHPLCFYFLFYCQQDQTSNLHAKLCFSSGGNFLHTDSYFSAAQKPVSSWTCDVLKHEAVVRTRCRHHSESGVFEPFQSSDRLAPDLRPGSTLNRLLWDSDCSSTFLGAFLMTRWAVTSRDVFTFCHITTTPCGETGPHPDTWSIGRHMKTVDGRTLFRRIITLVSFCMFDGRTQDCKNVNIDITQKCGNKDILNSSFNPFCLRCTIYSLDRFHRGTEKAAF